MNEFIFLPPRQLKSSNTVALPGSKSISNRILLLAALSDNVCQIHSLLQSDDTDRMLEALEKLGIPLQKSLSGSLKVTGQNGVFPNQHADLFLGNAGTAFRPLTAALAILGAITICMAWHECTNAQLVIWWTHCVLWVQMWNI